jgi:hypothetical protein
MPPITGRVYGIHGQSLAAAVVHAYQLEYTPYGRQLSLVKSELSNEGGEYRLVHLLPWQLYSRRKLFRYRATAVEIETER